jgi:DNA-binding response OmpR family regulator
VVDDEINVCFVLEKVLGKNGFVVDSYQDPLLALEKFKPHSYNLVILDIKMPDLNGFALYREIKRLDKKLGFVFLRLVKCTMVQIKIYLHYLPIVLFENQLKIKN